MSKIICDVCGTTYPDSANQCPICGSVRPMNTKSVEASNDASGNSRRENYTYVKGGRFSKKNVKKRNQRMIQEKQQSSAARIPETYEEGETGSKGLIVAIVLLLLAVVAVAGYITVRFFAPFDELFDFGNTVPATTVATAGAETSDTTAEATEETTEETTAETTAETTVATEITLNVNEVTLEKQDAEYALVATTNKEGVTITYNSANDAIATVSLDGKIKAISEGETVITVTCDGATAQCKVTCKFTPGESDNTFVEPYSLNKSDVMIKVGESFKLVFRDANRNPIPAAFEIQKPDVCSMDGNTVTGTAKGNSNITVNYNGQKYSCIVRVY